MTVHRVAVVACLAALAGCTPAGPSSPAPTDPAAPAASTPASTPAFAVPARAAAVDVTATGTAAFASPTGRIRCSLTPGGVTCSLPVGYLGRVPTPATTCPGTAPDTRVDAVLLAPAGAGFTCDPDAAAPPVRGRASTAWVAAGGGVWATPEVGGEVATLPYGRSIAVGDYVCASEEAGVTCAHGPTGHAMLLRRAGIVFG